MGRLEKGQSMVELAIALPLLLLFLLGVFEVGYALRMYMQAATLSREAARFASKSSTLDLDQADADSIGFTKVFSHNRTLIQQMPGWQEGRVGLVLSAFQFPAFYPCDPDTRAESIEGDAWPNCDCLLPGFVPHEITIGKHPGLYPQLTFGYPSNYSSRINFEDQYSKRYDQHIQVTCVNVKTSTMALPKEQVEVTAEVFYKHRQLFGFPLFEWIMPDEVTFYIPTTMRITESREYDFPPTPEAE